MESQSTFIAQLDWVTSQMPRAARALANWKATQPARIAICTHLDIKMVPVYAHLLAQGHKLFVTTCDPNTVRDEVVQYLKERGAETFAWQGMSDSDWHESLKKAVKWQPEYICEFGGELTSVALAENLSSLKGVLEGTGSGVAKLSSQTLNIPVLNWDDLDAKEGLHNRHMVGLTAWQAFMHRTHLSLHEKAVTVLGYGLVGQGVAAAAKAFGGQVRISERDDARGLMARYDGWHTEALPALLASTDVLVTATGAKGVIGLAELSKLKDGAFVMNVGHGTGEIRTSELADLPHREVMPYVFEYQINDKTLYLLANGAMFNLTAGFGDSLNAFDVTLGIMAGGLRYLMASATNLPAGMQVLPDTAWKPEIAGL